MTRLSATLRVCSAISIITVALGTFMAGPASATGIEIAVGAPTTVTIGQEVEVKVVMSEDGTPLEGTEVALTYQATLSGVSTRVQLATAITDETGTAVMIYQQRADDNREMQIVYLGPGTDPVTPYTFTIAVEGDPIQLYTAESGLKIPFLNGTLVIFVIAGVWALIALSAIYLVRVGMAGRLIEEGSHEDGSMWISVLLATAVAVTALGMVIVFIRGPVANTHITDPDGYDRTIVNYLDVSYPYEGFGLSDQGVAETGDPFQDGSALYFQYGCGACHGRVGQGAVVGPALVGEIGSIGSFTEDLREGPNGMPAYDEATISDEELEKIYRFLDEEG